MSAPNPLADLIVRALDGAPPPADGGWRRVPPWRTGLGAIVAMTGHAMVAVDADIDDERLDALGIDGYGGAHHPRVILDLSGPNGWIDSLDALLAMRSPGGPPTLVARDDLLDHPRVQFATAVRDVVHVLGPADKAQRSVATVSHGIGGLWEISVEVPPLERGRGLGADLVRGALAVVPTGQVAVAAVAPGNVASDRLFRGCGFSAVGSVQLFRRAPGPD